MPFWGIDAAFSPGDILLRKHEQAADDIGGIVEPQTDSEAEMMHVDVEPANVACSVIRSLIS